MVVFHSYVKVAEGIGTTNWLHLNLHFLFLFCIGIFSVYLEDVQDCSRFLDPVPILTWEMLWSLELSSFDLGERSSSFPGYGFGLPHDGHGSSRQCRGPLRPGQDVSCTLRSELRELGPSKCHSSPTKVNLNFSPNHSGARHLSILKPPCRRRLWESWPAVHRLIVSDPSEWIVPDRMEQLWHHCSCKLSGPFVSEATSAATLCRRK